MATQLERDREIAARRQAEAERTALLATLAHDLKSPLTTARGLAQLLLRGAKRGQPAAPDLLGHRLEQIVASTDRATALIDVQLNFARAQFDQPAVLEPRPTDLLALVRRVAAEQAPLAPGHRIAVATDHDTLIVPLDARQIERVLANLLGNAIKYSPNGGVVTLTLGRAEEAGTAWAVLAVADTGIGIPATDLPQIGEPFRRGGNVLGQIAGTGLGLASVRQIVAGHSGTVTLASTEGAGTTVTVRLPLPPHPRDEAGTSSPCGPA